VLRLQDQHLVHRHRVERGPAALGSVAVAEPLDQPSPEIFEIYRRIENLERIAMPAQRLKLLRQSEKTPLIHQTAPCCRPRASESHSGRSRQLDAGVQLS
jgi:hypothetical protein